MSACNNEHEAGQLAMFSSSPCEIVILANFCTKKYNHSLPSLPLWRAVLVSGFTGFG